MNDIPKGDTPINPLADPPLKNENSETMYSFRIYAYKHPGDCSNNYTVIINAPDLEKAKAKFYKKYVGWINHIETVWNFK